MIRIAIAFVCVLAASPAFAKDKFTWNFDLGPNVSPQINDIVDGSVQVKFDRDDLRVVNDNDTFTIIDRNVRRFVGEVDGEPLSGDCVVGHIQLHDFDWRGTADGLVIDCTLDNGVFTAEVRTYSEMDERLFPYDHFLGVASPIGVVPNSHESIVYVKFDDGRVRNGRLESWTGTKSND